MAVGRGSEVHGAGRGGRGHRYLFGVPSALHVHSGCVVASSRDKTFIALHRRNGLATSCPPRFRAGKPRGWIFSTWQTIRC